MQTELRMLMAESQFSDKKMNSKKEIPQMTASHPDGDTQCLLYATIPVCCPDIRRTQLPSELHLK